MTILLLRQYNPYIENGASANRFRGLIDGLLKLGHTVDIAVVGGLVSSSEASFYDDSVIYLSRANHYSFVMARLNRYLFEGLNNAIARHNFRKIDLTQYDILWITEDKQVLSLYISSKKRIHCKTFIELNEFNDLNQVNDKNINFLQRLYGNKSEDIFSKAIREIDLFGIMTKTLLNHYQQLSKQEASFIHLPMTVDINRFDNIQTTTIYKKPYIAFTGTMNNQKDGVDVLIKSFALIANKYRELNLYLAGFWYYDVPSQDELIVQYNLEDRVHRLGILDRNEVPSFLCNASVLALSRPDSYQAQGGFPTKLGEYLATGNPVCVTKVGEIADYLDDGISAFFAEPGNVSSFADALDRALSDSESAKRVGANGRKVAEDNFCSELQARRLADFLIKNTRK